MSEPIGMKPERSRIQRSPAPPTDSEADDPYRRNCVVRPRGAEDMRPSLSAERIAEIEARVAAAHPGPWRVVGADAWRLEGFPQVEMNTPGGLYFPVNDDVTAAFVAHARTDIPDLLAEIARLKPAVSPSPETPGTDQP